MHLAIDDSDGPSASCFSSSAAKLSFRSLFCLSRSKMEVKKKKKMREAREKKENSTSLFFHETSLLEVSPTPLQSISFSSSRKSIRPPRKDGSHRVTAPRISSERERERERSSRRIISARALGSLI